MDVTASKKSSNFSTKYQKLQISKMKILLADNDLLHKKCDKVVEFDYELEALVDQLYLHMYDNKGIGLAAPQLGITKCLFVIDVRDDKTGSWLRKAFINPKITGQSAATEIGSEGCLSIPGVYINVERSKFVTVEYQDVKGNQQILSASGLIARCIQHEIDHLDGVLMTDIGFGPWT